MNGIKKTEMTERQRKEYASKLAMIQPELNRFIQKNIIHLDGDVDGDKHSYNVVMTMWTEGGDESEPEKIYISASVIFTDNDQSKPVINVTEFKP